MIVQKEYSEQIASSEKKIETKINKINDLLKSQLKVGFSICVLNDIRRRMKDVQIDMENLTLLRQYLLYSKP